jgi:hypothetical protein
LKSDNQATHVTRFHSTWTLVFRRWLRRGTRRVAGCATPAQFLDSKQGMAVDTAAQRARFEMNCPDAIGTVISREVIQPVVFGGMQRAEFTVGVAGCGQRKTLVVVCQEGSEGCFAARSDAR